MARVTIDLNGLNLPVETWQTRILLIVGSPCVGKHALAREMCKKEKNLICLPSVTTRGKRPSDSNGEIICMAVDKFEMEAERGRFFYINKKTHASYAYSKTHLQQKIFKGESVILIFHSRGALALKRCITGIPTIFLTAPIEVIMKRCKKRTDVHQISHHELLDVVSRNEHAYDLFESRENCCIGLQNSIDEPPIAQATVEKAIVFRRRFTNR